MIDFSLDDLFDASISSARATRLAANDPFVKAWGSKSVALDASLPRRPLRDLRKSLVLSPVRPNLGIQAAYRRRLTALIEQMHTSLSYWLEAAYKANPPKIAQDAAARPLYVRRDVLNGSEIVAWAKAQGFPSTLAPDDMHVTVCFSKKPVDWEIGADKPSLTIKGGERELHRFGDAVVLTVASEWLEQRHEEFKAELGATWDHESYRPHITITWSIEDFDWESVEPYAGRIDLGPEIFEPVKEKWRESVKEVAQDAVLAQDELSSSALRAAMRKLSRRWLRNFDTAATKLADYFAQDVSKRSDAQLKKILKDGGFSVEFKLSQAQRDVLNATVAENVSLIRSIPREYLTRVESAVMRSVQTGRDMKQLSDDLQQAFGLSKKRAATISRDQSNKATAMLTRARHLELGITENVWVHSAGGKTPRPTHVKAGADGVTFDVVKGWLDPAIGRYIWPGTEINCRCVGRPVIKALQG